MIELCREAGLPEPAFEQRSGFFVVTLCRDWLTSDVLAEMSLNERQKQAVDYLKKHGKISNPDYQQLNETTKKTATRDLADMKNRKIVDQVGSRGPGVHYVLRRKGAKMGTMGT